MKKVYDVVVKVGEKSDGKAMWQNVGVVMKGDKGPFLLLNRYFNPAGVPGNEGKASVLCSLFEPKDNEFRGGGSNYNNGGFNEDVPF